MTSRPNHGRKTLGQYNFDYKQNTTGSIEPFVLFNIGQLITLSPLAASLDFRRISAEDLGTFGPAAWLAIDQSGKVAGFGAQGGLGDDSPFCDWLRIDAKGGLVLPGLVDSHTHPLWSGSRAQEFVLKAAGRTYQEIAAGGGGIKATVYATRNATDEGLGQLALGRLKSMLAYGTTTVEVKSGYGLSVREELRHLSLLNQVAKATPQTLSITCLALHAHSPDGTDVPTYVAQCAQELLPEAARHGLIASVDAFVEQGYFTAKDTAPYLQAAQDLGLMIRLHADEFTDSGAAALGAQWGARSVDHLQAINLGILPQLAPKGPPSPGDHPTLVATLLPGTSLYSRLPWADGRRLRQHGIPVALASDYNPGSCLLSNLPLVASLGAVHCGLTLEEVLAAVTIIPAYSLGLCQGGVKKGGKGSLACGFDGDFFLHPAGQVSQWLADFGQTRPEKVWILGREHG